MRKFLAFSFGLLVFASLTHVFTSNAGYTNYWKRYYRSTNLRNSGQVYRNSIEYNKRPIRATSNRIGPFRYRAPVRSVAKYGGLDYSHPTGRHDAWYYADYRESLISNRARKEILRLAQPQFYPRNENRLGIGKNIVRHNDYVQVASGVTIKPSRIALYNNEGTRKRISLRNMRPDPVFKKNNKSLKSWYTFDISEDFVRATNGNYESKNSSLAFRVIRTKGDYTCVQGTLEECAINLTKEFRDSQKLVRVATLEKDLQWKQTVEDLFIGYPTLVESFYANGYGMENVYFIFNALDPINGSVVRIEAVARNRDTKSASQVMHKIFESFRFKII